MTTITFPTPSPVTIEPDAVPLRVQDGMIVIVGTRIPIDTVIFGHNQGHSPEKIAEEYPSLSVADVYSTIAYYLRHRDQLDAYVAAREREAREIQKQIESQPGYRESIQRLLQRAREQGRTP